MAKELKNSKEIIKMLQAQDEVVLVGPLYNGVPSLPVDKFHIFVDGGSNYIPDEMAEFITVGDGDSTKISLDITLPKDKDYSDLRFALNMLPMETKKIYLYGFLGGRGDHELINFGEVHDFLKNRTDGTMVTYDRFWVAYNKGSHTIKINGLFSVIVIEETLLKILGPCQYPLNDFRSVSPLSSFILSNIGRGLITFVSKGPFFIYQQGIMDE